MTFSTKRLSLLIILVFSSMILLDLSLPLLTKDAKPLIYYAMAQPRRDRVNLEPHQFFSGAAGSIIEYNVYIENRGRSVRSFTLSALSDEGYYIEIWRDTDQIGSGDLQLFPPQGSTITLSPGEVATLIVKVTIPSDATDGTVDHTIIEAEDTVSGASDFVIISTTVAPDLPWPSSWIQLGSDPNFPIPRSRIDIKASYHTNNGTHVFFRTAVVRTPSTQAFEYLVYLDTKTGGQQIDSYNYDYLLSSDGILYVWNGTDWLNSGYPTYLQIEGTSIVLWTDLGNIVLDTQEIHFLSSTATKDGIMRDNLGPYTILTSSISEFPFILFPLLTLAVYLAILRRNKKECAQA